MTIMIIIRETLQALAALLTLTHTRQPTSGVMICRGNTIDSRSKTRGFARKISSPVADVCKIITEGLLSTLRYSRKGERRLGEPASICLGSSSLGTRVAVLCSSLASDHQLKRLQEVCVQAVWRKRSDEGRQRSHSYHTSERSKKKRLKG